MENSDNQNTQYHIAHTKLFKSSFPGANGSDNEPRSLDILQRLQSKRCNISNDLGDNIREGKHNKPEEEMVTFPMTVYCVFPRGAGDKPRKQFQFPHQQFQFYHFTQNDKIEIDNDIIDCYH